MCCLSELMSSCVQEFLVLLGIPGPAVVLVRMLAKWTYSNLTWICRQHSFHFFSSFNCFWALWNFSRHLVHTQICNIILEHLTGRGEDDLRSAEKTPLLLNLSDTLASRGLCRAILKVPHPQGAHRNKLVADCPYVLLPAGSSSLPNLWNDVCTPAGNYWVSHCRRFWLCLT